MVVYFSPYHAIGDRIHVLAARCTNHVDTLVFARVIVKDQATVHRWENSCADGDDFVVGDRGTYVGIRDLTRREFARYKASKVRKSR